MRLPIGKKGLLTVLPIVAGVVFWRVRASKRAEEDRRWSADIEAAADEGIAAARAPGAPPQSSS